MKSCRLASGVLTYTRSTGSQCIVPNIHSSLTSIMLSSMLGHDRTPGVVQGYDYEKNVFGPAVSVSSVMYRDFELTGIVVGLGRRTKHRDLQIPHRPGQSRTIRLPYPRPRRQSLLRRGDPTSSTNLVSTTDLDRSGTYGTNRKPPDRPTLNSGTTSPTCWLFALGSMSCYGTIRMWLSLV